MKKILYVLDTFYPKVDGVMRFSEKMVPDLVMQLIQTQGFMYLIIFALDIMSKKYDAIIIAVSHKVFTELARSEYESISTEKPVLIDIKGIVEDPTWLL